MPAIRNTIPSSRLGRLAVRCMGCKNLFGRVSPEQESASSLAHDGPSVPVAKRLVKPHREHRLADREQRAVSEDRRIGLARQVHGRRADLGCLHHGRTACQRSRSQDGSDETNHLEKISPAHWRGPRPWFGSYPLPTARSAHPAAAPRQPPQSTGHTSPRIVTNYRHDRRHPPRTSTRSRRQSVSEKGVKSVWTSK